MRAGIPQGYPQTSWRRRLAAAAALALAALLAGCGHSGPAGRVAAAHTAPLPRSCARGALDAMARALAVRASTIALSTSTGGDAMPQCAFATRLTRSRRVEVTVNVDNGPQPYFVLERTIVEASQTWGAPRPTPAPIAVTGLGLEAAWFPAETHLEATDGTLLITATVAWPGVGQKREAALARAMTRPYLKTPHGKAAAALAHGYASG